MFTNILWASDGSARADDALEYATELARSEGAPLHAVHVVEKLVGPRISGQDTYLNEKGIDAKIRGQVHSAADQGIDASLELTAATGSEVAEVISEIASERGTDVIVVGSRGRSALAGVLTGSVTQRLLHLAGCPVLVVPPRPAASSTAHAVESEPTTG